MKNPHSGLSMCFAGPVRLAGLQDISARAEKIRCIAWLPADAQPLVDSIREQLVEPFVKAICITFAEMAGIDLAVRGRIQLAVDFDRLIASRRIRKIPYWSVVLPLCHLTAASRDGYFGRAALLVRGEPA